jgi:hypothetical protein
MHRLVSALSWLWRNVLVRRSQRAQVGLRQTTSMVEEIAEDRGCSPSAPPLDPCPEVVFPVVHGLMADPLG